MPKNARLAGSLDEIELGFVEREATPTLLMSLSIQLHLAGLSLSNTVSVLEIFGVERARSRVHSWVHKVELQPVDGRESDHVTVDETVIRHNDEQYWPEATVDPATNDLLHTQLELTTNSVLAQQFLRQLREKHDVEDAKFLIDGSASLNDACSRQSLNYRVDRHDDRNRVEHVFREGIR